MDQVKTDKIFIAVFVTGHSLDVNVGGLIWDSGGVPVT